MSQQPGSKDKQYGPAGRRRRAELMEAAVVLASQNGFAKTRVSDIVGRVGVGQGVFYWYFESKDALFQEIFNDTTMRLRLFQWVFVKDETDPLRLIAKGILASLEFIIHNRHAFAILDHASAQDRWRRQRVESLRVHVVDVAHRLQAAVDDGLVRRTDPAYLALGITGTVDRMARSFLADERTDIDAVAQEAIDFCLGGMTGQRLIDVAELRAEVAMIPELLELRDRIGAGAMEQDGR